MLTDGGVESVDVEVVEAGGHRLEHGGRQLLGGQALPPELLLQVFPALFPGVFPALPREPLADLVGRPRRLDDLQPVSTRSGSLHLRGEDLAGVARAQLVAQRHEPTVHAGADAGVAHLGVHGIGEVDGRGPLRHGDHPPLGREHVDLVLFEVDLQGLHELGGVGRLLLPVDDAVEPGQLVGGRADLVGEVSGHAELGALVHLTRSQLHLERLALGSDHGGVQRLVQVELGHGHVVLEPALHRPPGGVDRPEGRIAVTNGVDEDPDPHQVEDVVELAALHHHLLVDAPQVLRPAAHLGVDPQLRQAHPHLLEHLLQVDLPLRSAGGHHVVDLRELLGVERGEAEVLELLLEVLHAEPVSERRVDVERLAGDADLGVGRHGPDGPHVVEPVGQLDHEDP